MVKLLRLALLTVQVTQLGFAQQGTAEQAIRRFGLRLLESSQYQAIQQAYTPFHNTLPPAVDLSGDMPPVANQGEQDSCVAWSTAYAVRTYFERTELKWDVRTPDREFSPAFVYNQIAQGRCDQGIQFTDALNLLTARGVATLAEMPYSATECRSQPSVRATQDALNYRIAGYRRVNVADVNEIKAQLAAHYPVLVALDTDQTFYTLGRNQIWTSKGPTKFSHAVALVGYNDSQRWVKLINSWGTTWGTDGFGYISYDLMPTVAKEGYVVTPFHVHDPTPAQPAREANIRILRIDPVYQPTPGVNIQLEYTLRGYSGHNGQIAVYFWFQNGQRIRATMTAYSDAAGNSGAGTPVFSIPKDEYDNYHYAQFMPSSGLLVPAGQYVIVNGQQEYQPLTTPVLVQADLFIDNFGVARSETSSFSVYR